jgi:hypothetical protein
MGAYNSMMPGYASTVNSYMNNPFGNPFMQQQQQMGTNQANNLGATGMANTTRNLNMSGISQNSPAALQMMQQQMMNNSSTKANLGFLQPMQNALGMQQSAMQQAGSFKPLQTGQTQSQGGVGSWLPQILGGGLSLLTGGLLGGGGGGAAQTAGQVNNVWGSGAMTNMSSPMTGAGFGSYGGGTSMGQNAPDAGGYNFAMNPFMQ